MLNWLAKQTGDRILLDDFNPISAFELVFFSILIYMHFTHQTQRNSSTGNLQVEIKCILFFYKFQH